MRCVDSEQSAERVIYASVALYTKFKKCASAPQVAQHSGATAETGTEPCAEVSRTAAGPAGTTATGYGNSKLAAMVRHAV